MELTGERIQAHKGLTLSELGGKFATETRRKIESEILRIT